MSKIQKWKLLSSIDISPSPFFPLEKRKYELPDGRIVDDFYVTTLADSVHIIPVTKEGKVVMIRMYKQGIDAIVIQFPAGRIGSKHSDALDAAVQELKEEAGIEVDRKDLIYVDKRALMTTKASEQANIYLAPNVSFNSEQNLDNAEEIEAGIEVLEFTPDQIDAMILSGEIIEGIQIAEWYLVRQKFPEYFSKTT